MDNNQYSSNNPDYGQYGSQYGYSRPAVQQNAPTIQLGEGNAVYTKAETYTKMNNSRSGSGGSGIFKGIVIGCIAASLILGVIGGVIGLMKDNTQQVPQKEEVDLVISESPVTDNTVGSNSSGKQLTYAQIAEKVRRAVVSVSVYTDAYGWGSYIYSEGSGFIISEDGYIVTNSHVIQDEKHGQFKITVFIEAEDGTSTEHEVEVVGQDTRTDLAVLKLKENVSGLVVAELGDSTVLVLGDEVVAIGNPGGAQFAGSVTNGIVSGLNRVIDDSGTSSDNAMKYLQTNAAINPGNSGGPLLNMYGQVIGINTAKIAASGYEGLGFAIPMHTAKPIIEELINVGSVVRPVVGISCTEITEQMAAWYDVPVGIMIREISPYSKLDEAGVQVGDIITACEGQPIATLSQLQEAIEKYEVGDRVTFTVFRPGRGSFETEVELIADSASAQQQNSNPYFELP